VTQQLDRVNAYTFRGDSRTPEAVRRAGGFNPPITRTDTYYQDEYIYPAFSKYMKKRFNMDIDKPAFARAWNQTVAYPGDKMVLHNFFFWRSMVENEQYHIGKMLADETLKGFISTTRSTMVAKGFAGNGGWVYLTLIKGGFLVPDKGKHVWTQTYGEQEIALPAPVPWEDIFGFRQVGPDERVFVGPVYFRRGFAARNPTAHQQAYELLSGKLQ
jgi:hypothetical protein